MYKQIPFPPWQFLGQKELLHDKEGKAKIYTQASFLFFFKEKIALGGI